MPYRRLPKTDAARLKALKTLLDNNDIYTVRNNFVGWKSLNKAQSLHGMQSVQASARSTEASHGKDRQTDAQRIDVCESFPAGSVSRCRA